MRLSFTDHLTDFGYESSRKSEIYGNATVISLAGYGYDETAKEVSVYGQNWTLYQGIYYSMISLTTVGFGDYYLGRPDDPKQASKQNRMNVSYIISMMLVKILK